MFFNDKAGHSYQRGFSLTYAHHINFNDDRNSRASRPGFIKLWMKSAFIWLKYWVEFHMDIIYHQLD